MSGVDGIRIRPAAPDDLAEIVALERRCFDDPWPAHSLAAELEPDSRRWCLVAERTGLLEGYIMGWHVADELHVVNVAVAPEARRGGLATGLLETVLGRLRASGGGTATLEVRRSNVGALAFYHRHGFRETGVRRAYYRDNGEDALILSLPVPPEA